MINRAARRTAGLIFILPAIALSACSFSTPAPTPNGKWAPISQQAGTSPQIAEDAGKLPDRCADAIGVTGDRPILNGTVIGDRSDYLIERGDKLHLSFYRNGEFDQDVVVTTDGRSTIRPFGPVAVIGLTPQQFADQLDQRFSSILIVPGANVAVVDSPSRVVYVGGQVTTPGVQQLRPGMTAIQALIGAGWLKDDADTAQAVIIRRDACGRPYGSIIQVKNAAFQLLQGDQQDAALLPSDVIVVPRTTIGNLNVWVTQYIRNMLPMEPYIGINPPF